MGCFAASGKRGEYRAAQSNCPVKSDRAQSNLPVKSDRAQSRIVDRIACVFQRLRLHPRCPEVTGDHPSPHLNSPHLTSVSHITSPHLASHHFIFFLYLFIRPINALLFCPINPPSQHTSHSTPPSSIPYRTQRGYAEKYRATAIETY